MQSTEILNYNIESKKESDVFDVNEPSKKEQTFPTSQIINLIQTHTTDLNTQKEEDGTALENKAIDEKQQQEEEEEECKSKTALLPSSFLPSSASTSTSSSLSSSAGSAATAQQAKTETTVTHIIFHKNVDKDDIGYKAILEGATNPQVMRWVFDSLRTVLLVTFPMFVIGTHPNTMTKLGFPQLMVAAVISTSTHRPTIGEQLRLHSWVWCGVIYMMVTNTIFVYFNIVNYLGAWWAMIALGIFAASLIGHGFLRRFMYLYFFVHMMMIRMEQNFFGLTPLSSPYHFGTNIMMGTLFGLMASLLPFLSLIATCVDEICFKLFDGTGKLMMAMQKYVWSPDPHAALLFFNDQSSLTKIEEILTHLPALLWFTNWEPLEFPLRNPIRRLKLALLRRIMALMYAAFSTGQTISRLRVEQAERVAMASMRSHVGRRLQKQRHNRVHHKQKEEYSDEQEIEEDSNLEVNGEHGHTNHYHNSANNEFTEGEQGTNKSKYKRTSSALNAEPVTVAFAEGTSVAGPNMIERAKEDLEPNVYLRMREARRELRESAQEHVNAFMPVLMKSMTMLGGAGSTPETLLETIPFDHLIEVDTLMRRSIRLDVLQAIHHMDRIVQERLAKRKASSCKPGIETDEENSTWNTHYSTFSSGKDQNWNTDEEKEANDKIIDDTMTEAQQLITDNEVFIRLYGVYFHLLFNMIAGEIQSFGEMMENYKPEHSLSRRLLNYLIIESWREFRSELINRLTLARPYDVRLVKDAIKMTCAYLCACALNFELWIPPQGTYFFGTTIMLGLPVEEESLNMGINRIAGNSLGCALGFLAYHNTGDYAQMIACVLSFVFICQCFKNHPLYGQTFFYASVMTMAGMATSINSLELFTRVLTCTYTIVAYMLCCMLIFPTNGIKVLENYRAKLSKVMSEIIDDVALTAHLPLNKQNAHPTQNLENMLVQRQVIQEEELQESHAQMELNTENVPYYNHFDLTRSTSRARGNNNNNYIDSIMCQNDINHICTQLNVEVELMRELLSLCAKWTPFAVREPIVRGIQTFPSAASATIHAIHRRMTGSVQLLVFGMQLLHRPRNEDANETIQRILSGTVAEFLDEFARLTRLLLQDFIDSTQCSRTWSYSVVLSHTSELMRLKVKLQGVLYETFFMLGLPATSTMMDFSSAQIAMLRNERIKKKNSNLIRRDKGKQTTLNKEMEESTVIIYDSENADIEVNTDKRKEDINNIVNNVQKTYNNFSTSNKSSEDHKALSAIEYRDSVRTDSDSQHSSHRTAIHEPINDSNIGEEENNTSRCESSLYEPFHNSFAGINPNMSFAGRILQARRTAAQSTQVHDFPLMRETSTLLPGAECNTCQYNVDSNALGNNESNDNYWRNNSFANSISSRVNIGPRRRMSNISFVHTAPLIKAHTAPQDSYPYSVQSVEHDMAQKLELKQKQKQKQQQNRKQEVENELRRSFVGDKSLNCLHRLPSSLPNTSSTNQTHSDSGYANGQGEENEMQNTQQEDNTKNSEVEFAPCTRRTASRLVLVPERGAETSLPTYEGPKFSYREDEVELPEDTDHLALVCILASCNQIMQEFEKLAGSTNNISVFQKQLHETTRFLPLITRLTTKIRQIRRDNYDKYHKPPPPLSSESSTTTLTSNDTSLTTSTALYNKCNSDGSGFSGQQFIKKLSDHLPLSSTPPVKLLRNKQHRGPVNTART